MSLTRNLFNEFRPFFRLFDEVSRTYPSYPIGGHHWDRDVFPLPSARRPSLDLSEQGNEYIVEAELPGVKKENLDVRVGDQGRSLTIEGRIPPRSTASNGEASSTDASQSTSTEVTQSQGDSSMQLSSEREFVGSSHFTRTVWLPRPVDGSKVTGSLSDGILTLRVPKAADQGSVKVEIQ